ncbi:MAG: hypothetical protein Kow00109_11320 [Acidobacteriota bacterium]
MAEDRTNSSCFGADKLPRTPAAPVPRAARWGALLALATWIGTSSCRLDMHDQPRYESYEASDFFEDGSAGRIPPRGTVAQGELFADELLYTGKLNGQDADVLPFPVTRELLDRGQERFNIFCSPCHDRAGTGHGIIVERGMKQPPSLHILRLREAPIGHFFDVITNGYGEMFSYASRIPPRDRWAIAAYIRALQLSQNAATDELTPADLRRLEMLPPAGTDPGTSPPAGTDEH